MTVEYNREERIRELEQLIAGYCISSRCSHLKFVTGQFECDRKRSQCHSSRVRKWLNEIKRLEKEKEGKR